MRRGVTVLVVVVVAAIALAAGFDALRGESASEPAAQSETEPPVSTTNETEESAPEAELTGTLYYTDESCELQAIELPGQRPVEAPGWDECRFVLSPHRRRVAGAGSGWDPRSDPLIGRLFQSEDGRIQVSTNRGPEGAVFAGRAPAWRPDGTLTYFADGAVREWPSGDVVLSQRDLVRALRTLPIPELATRYDRFRVREAAWLDDRRLAAILSADGPESREDMLAIYDGTELDQFTFDGPGGLSELRASPGGRYVAARSTGGRDAPGGFVMIESGRELNTPRLVGYRALAWSPDEQWVAIAAEGGVFVYRPGAPGPPELELDLDAQDLAWRGEAGPPTLAAAGEAREWLDGLATGRLFVTLSEGSKCTLRAILLPDLQWEERPPGLPTPCHFELDESDEVIAGNAVPQPGGGQVAVCQRNAVDVFNEEGLLVGYPGGCAPAWTPDGRLTFVRNGALVEPVRSLLSRRELEDLLGRPSALEEVAWVDDERFWAVVRSGAGSILALMTVDRLVFTPSFTSRTIEGLRVSASGMVAARSDQGVVIFDSGGRRALTFPNGRAVAWQPGELIAAVATPTEILFVAPVSREVVSLPLAVSDLEWVIP
jgi:WD40-like Beta Propeller Repeat